MSFMTIMRASLRESHACCEFAFTNYAEFYYESASMASSGFVCNSWSLACFPCYKEKERVFWSPWYAFTVCAAFELLNQLTIFTKLSMSIIPLADTPNAVHFISLLLWLAGGLVWCALPGSYLITALNPWYDSIIDMLPSFVWIAVNVIVT
jgi:hypothetical protein